MSVAIRIKTVPTQFFRKNRPAPLNPCFATSDQRSECEIYVPRETNSLADCCTAARQTDILLRKDVKPNNFPDCFDPILESYLLTLFSAPTVVTYTYLVYGNIALGDTCCYLRLKAETLSL